MRPIDGRTAAYVCENYACQLPVTTVEEFTPLLAWPLVLAVSAKLASCRDKQPLKAARWN